MCVKCELVRQCNGGMGDRETYSTDLTGGGASRQSMTKEQIYTLDMLYMHQGWHPDCGIVMESLEDTKNDVDTLCYAGYVVENTTTGWYTLTQAGTDAVINWRNQIKN